MGLHLPFLTLPPLPLLPPAAVDPVAQKYVNDFNALINQGNYEDAARLVKEAELAGYGDEAYRAAAVALGAKANLPGGSDFIQPEGIQSIRDYVANVTNVDEFNKLIRDEEFGKAAAFAQSQGFTPDQVATYINENAANLGLSEGFGVTGENIATLYPGYVAPPPPAPVDPNVERFNSLIRTGNFKEAGELATEAGFTPEQVLTYLNDPNIFPEFGGNVTLDTVKSFVPKPPAPATAAPLKVLTDQLNELC
jgi:ABC-type transport system substrate-binding protein